MNSRRLIFAPEAQGGVIPTHSGSLKGVGTRQANVRFGSKADVAGADKRHVCFTPKADIGGAPGMSAKCHKRSYAESRLTDRVRPKADLTRRRSPSGAPRD